VTKSHFLKKHIPESAKPISNGNINNKQMQWCIGMFSIIKN